MWNGLLSCFPFSSLILSALPPFCSLELIVWLVPSLIGGALSIALIGVFLGPIYPILMTHAARVLPPWLLTGAIGYVASVGQAGSAAVPFATGAVAAGSGIGALQPL